MRILSGIQPSGRLHLGNYFGALQQFLDLQGQGEAIYFIADWHALTTVKDGALLRQHTQDVALDYLALGLDPDQSVIFRQSDVSAHAQLAWMLSTVTPMGLLERAHSYKDKVARGASTDVGLFFYPILMAADILLYGPDRVPVGQDQKQHLEIARDIAVKFNVAFGGTDPQNPSEHDLLKLPEPVILEQRGLVVGLDGQKMSKSYHNTLDLFAPEGELKKKIMGMPTDSTPVEAPKPEGHALLALLQLLATPEEAATLTESWHAGGTGYGSYKKRLLGLMLERFGPARTRRAELAQDLSHVHHVLERGALRAHELSAERWARIVRATGCGRTF